MSNNFLKISQSGRPESGASGLTPLVRSRRDHGFTLVELLLSMTILSVLMLVVVNVIGIVQQQWTRSNSRVTAFREARMAFDVLNRNLSQATLNTYWGTNDEVIGTDAAGQQRIRGVNYKRVSELQFVCGQTTGLIPAAAGQKDTYPGHGVFFQAPLGVTRMVAANGTAVDTENMVNLLCARGYFVSWGDDAAFRPAFLNSVSTVAPRFRYRLMEYSPSAEVNAIYYDPAATTSIASRRPIELRSKQWFADVLGSVVTSNDTAASYGFTRPVAENIIALVISPQIDGSNVGGLAPESIAPLYEYDSTLVTSPGAPTSANAPPQGTQHMLPPLLKLTMVALDSAAGAQLAERGNEVQQQRLAAVLGPLFVDAQGINNPQSTYRQNLQTIEDFLREEKLNYRVFTSTVVMKQARWSY